MKCDNCDKEFDSNLNRITNNEGKLFCTFNCKNQYYETKIAQLTKAEAAWHNEWFNSRKIIGELGMEIMKLKGR